MRQIAAALLLLAGAASLEAKDKPTAESLTDEGYELMNEGSDMEAAGIFKKATDMDAGLALAWNGWALALRQMGMHEQALNKSFRALELEPNDADYIYVNGLILIEMGRMNDAGSQFEKGTRADSTNADCWYGWGIVLSQQGLSDGALEKFRKAVELDPDYEEAIPAEFQGKL